MCPTLSLPPSVFSISSPSSSLWQPVTDRYDETTFCKYGSDATTVCGLSAFLAVLVSQGVVNVVEKITESSLGKLGFILVYTLFAFLSFIPPFRSIPRLLSGQPVTDRYDETTFCKYGSDAATVYGLSAFLAVLVSQGVVTGVTKCLCFGKGLTAGPARTCAVFSFVLSWSTFLGAEACLLAGSARNAYHTKYRAQFGVQHLSCAELREGVFAAGAALISTPRPTREGGRSTSTRVSP